MKIKLFASAALAALCFAAPAFAQTAAVATADAAAADVQAIVVYGSGQTRQIQSISNLDIVTATPGSSAVKIISKLPSVNFESADPFGAYEWAERITVRGFAQNQLGYTLDDVPLGDMTYSNDNGLHISRAISSENIGRTDLAQGTGGLDTASTSNIGGTLKFFSLDPSRTAGGTIAGTYGSYNDARVFARLESGELPGGGRGYISYTYQNADKWKGDGSQEQQQVNSKFVQPIGDKVTVTGFFNFSVRHEHDYQDMSLSLINRLGYKVDNISNNYALAKQIAEIGSNNGYTGVGIKYPGVGNVFPAPYTTADDVYFDGGGNRRDYLGGAKLDWQVTDALKVHATVYGHKNEGIGTWDTPYTPTPAADGGSPLSMRSTEYNIMREGLVSSATYEAGQHTIEASFWYENNLFKEARRFYGLGLDSPGRDAGSFQTDPFFTQWYNSFTTKTYVESLQDTWRVTDALKVNFGFKATHVDNSTVTIQADAADTINGKIDTDKPFLPQAGVNYRLDGNNELFADYSKNVRAFVSSHTDGPFSTTQAGFNAIAGSLKPETTDTGELGYRFHYSTFEGVLAGYYVKFHNRLLATVVGASIVGNPTALSNVGGVTSDGVEAAGTWKFAPNWSLFGSYSYNHSTYDDDTKDGTGAVVALTKGKTTPDTPQSLLKGELAYDDGSFYARLSGNYVGKRFYTYTNDQPVAAYFVSDLSVGYRVHAKGWLNGTEIQANVTNLLNKRYISTIGTNGFANADPTGSFQTLQVGSPREGFITLRKEF